MSVENNKAYQIFFFKHVTHLNKFKENSLLEIGLSAYVAKRFLKCNYLNCMAIGVL